MSDYRFTPENILKMGKEDDTIRHMYEKSYNEKLPANVSIEDLLQSDNQYTKNLVKLIGDAKTITIVAIDDLLAGKSPSDLEELKPEEFKRFKRYNSVRKWLNSYLDIAEITNEKDDKKPVIETPAAAPDIVTEADKILREGKPIEYFLATWHKDYKGYDHYGMSLIFSMFCGTCNNTRGLNPAADGDSGSGKTWAQLAMINLNHPDYKIVGMITPRAVFYNNVKPGTTIVMDDVGKMKDDLAQVYKVSCTMYQDGPELLGVDTNREGQKSKVPKCLNMWLSGVDVAALDIQINNRNVKIPLDETNPKIKKEQHDRVLDFMYDEAVTGRPAFQVCREVEICREISRQLLSAPQMNVAIPIVKDEDGTKIVLWNNSDNLRTWPQFTDMIRVSASIHRHQRKTVNGSIIATLEDFDYAARCWGMIERENVSGLNRHDQLIEQAMKDLGVDKYVDIYQIADKLNMKYPTVYKWVKGDEKNGIQGFIHRRQVSIKDQHETEFDTDIEIDDMGHEREKKKGSVGRNRFMIKLVGDTVNIENYSSIVTIDRARAKNRYESYVSAIKV